MRPFLYVAWLLAGEDAGADAVDTFVGAVRASGGAGAVGAYRLLPRTPVMQSINDRLDHVDVEAYPLPDTVVLAELDSLDAALDLDAHVRSTSAAVVVRGVYREVVAMTGTEAPPAEGYAPVIQLGAFNMRSAEDEWAVTEWYRSRRLPSFCASPGSIRVRRFVSVCGGPAKLAVLYEFTSLSERAEHFEALELVDHDEARPSAATRTVHAPMSPSVGVALDLT
jgi:hypothetical protein